MVLGLIFGLGAATWAFSGMLSMDPFPPLDASRRPRRSIPQALRGGVPVCGALDEAREMRSRSSVQRSVSKSWS